MKQRKERAAWFESQAKGTRPKRPGVAADGTSDGTLGLKDISQRLAIYNNGNPPADKEVLKLLMSSSVQTTGRGRVTEDQMEVIESLFLSRQERGAVGASSDKWSIDKKSTSQPGCCAIS